VFPDVSSAAARAQLDPHSQHIIEAMETGVRRFFEIQPATALYTLSKNPRVKANAIWAFITEEIETKFADVDGVKLVPRFGSLEIHVGPNMIARVKKMQPNGFTSNYSTKRVREFHSANQGELFATLWAKPMRVDIGYVENETGSGIAEIKVARRLKPRAMDWVYAMTRITKVTPIPAGAEAPATRESQVVGRIADSQPSTQVAGNNE
jgi:hypothetical protein